MFDNDNLVIEIIDVLHPQKDSLERMEHSLQEIYGNVTLNKCMDSLVNQTLKDIDFANSKLRFEVTDKTDEIMYPTVEIKCENVKLYDNTVCNNPRHPIVITKIS